MTNQLAQHEALGASATRIERAAGLIGLLGMVFCGFGFFSERAQFFHSYLFAFFYWFGFSIGGLGILLMNHVVGGKWGVMVRKFLEAQMRTLPFMLVLFLPILLGAGDLYPWTHSEIIAHEPVLQHKALFLNMPFFVIRLVVYFAVWIFWGYRLNFLSDKQDRAKGLGIENTMRAFSAPGLLVFVLSVTFAYIDWVLSINIQFSSTVFGVMLLIGQILQSFAFVIAVLIWLSARDEFKHHVTPQVLHDLGNLMFAFTIFWTYLSLSQLIIVWPGNLPQEIGWYLERVRGGWAAITVVIVLSMFVLPFFLLLSQGLKRDPKRLLRVAIWIMAAKVLDAFWVIEPAFRPNGFTLYWTDLASFVAVGGIWIYLFLGQLRRRPLLPLQDSRLMAPLARGVA